MLLLHTKLHIDTIRHQYSDDGFFTIKLHNDLYHISIRYMQSGYQLHKNKQDFQPNDILITIKESSPMTPTLIIQFQTEFSKELFGLEPSYTTGIVPIPKIKDYNHLILGAHHTLLQLRLLFQEYFPGILQT